MYAFGPASRKKLDTCHEQIVVVAEHALQRSPYDITIIHGWRGEDVQNALQESGASTKRWPDSKHNHCDRAGAPESLAIDFAPWVNGGIQWNDTHIFAAVAGVMMAAAADLGVRLRWGGDWDGDGMTTDQKLLDWGHVELVL